MSLKALHIVFVSLSVLLSVGFSAWVITAYTQGRWRGLFASVAVIGSMTLAVALLCYGVWFLRKMKDPCYR